MLIKDSTSKYKKLFSSDDFIFYGKKLLDLPDPVLKK